MCTIDELYPRGVLTSSSPPTVLSVEAEEDGPAPRQLYGTSTPTESTSMAQMTSDGAEPDSQSTCGPDRSSEAAETGGERRAVPDHKQEPGDNKESPAGMDGSGGRAAAAVPTDNRSPVGEPGTQGTTPGDKTEEDEAEAALKLREPGKSHARSSLARSSESAQEQRDGENTFSSAPSEPGKTPERVDLGTKRRASVERTSSDGEPLSRMDSEDRLVKVVLVNWEAPSGAQQSAVNLVWPRRAARVRAQCHLSGTNVVPH